MSFKPLFFTLIFGKEMLSQKLDNCYFEITANSKISTRLRENTKPTLSTAYFLIEQQKTIMPIGLSPLLLGMNFGYEFENKNKLQIGFSQDGIVQGIRVVGIEKVKTPNPNTYGITELSEYGGVSTTNFSLIYKLNILKFKVTSVEKNIYLGLHLNFGVSYIYKPNNGYEALTNADWSYLSIDSNYVEIQYRPINLPLKFKNSLKFNLGFDMIVGKKNKEWFSFNFAFITNRSDGNVFIAGNTKIIVTDKFNKKTNYFYSITGTGNGIYFGISKRFYPIKWNKERLQKKIDLQK